MTGANKTHGERVKLRILETGVRLWLLDPALVTARRIAAEMGMTHAAVLYHFGTSARLKDAIAAHAVERGEARIIGHLIMSGHRAVKHMPFAERAAYLRAAASA